VSAPAEYAGDDLADAVALVLATLTGDAPGTAAIMASSNWHHVALTLARLLSVCWSDTGCSNPDHLRAWAAEAMGRRLRIRRLVLA
jgi:hypothetical protein